MPSPCPFDKVETQMKKTMRWALASWLIALLCLSCVGALAQETPADGLYTVGVESSASMFRVVRCVLSVQDGAMEATLTMSGTGYGYLYPGTSEEASAAPEADWVPFREDAQGRYCFTVPIPGLDQDVAMAAYSKKYEKWYDRTLVFTSSTLHAYTPQPETQEEREAASLPDGVYAVEAQSDSGLFRITGCVLTVQDGAMSARITVENSAYAYLYAGRAKDARTAQADWIAAEQEEGGAQAYTMPISALDSEIPVATYSEKKRMWYDRTVTLKSDTAQCVEEPAAEDGASDETQEAAALEDGVYEPDGFTFSGGSGKVTISCPKVTVSGGQAVATLVFSSSKYGYVRVGEEQIFGEHDETSSTFEVPVTLNTAGTIIGMTTAMSTEHEVEYTICVKLGGQDDARLPGLAYVETMPLRYATGFSVDSYEGGYRRIAIEDGDTYLVVPEGMEAPDGLDPSIIVLRQPLTSIYLAASSVMSLFDALDALSAIRMTGTAVEDWTLANAVRAMEVEEILYAGKYDKPDFEMLLREGCDLALESTMILHSPKVKEMIELLGIPVMIDRSSYESHPLGRTEWIKLYGALLGREEQAQAFFDAQAAVLEGLDGAENTGKTVAFFYVSANGSIVVRGVEDYVPRMIELAGGRYIFDGQSGLGEGTASVNMTPESFYTSAIDADYIIYNATIAEPPENMEELIQKNSLFADFKAVKSGDVFCMSKSMYQATDSIAGVIADIHAMLEGQREGMTYLRPLE